MILGLTGPIGVGKTTVANLLVTKAGFVRVSFADHLRLCAEQMFGLCPEAWLPPLKDEVNEFWGQTPRHILQVLGTEVARAIHPDVWVRAWERRVEIMNMHQDRPLDVVADDLRFDNEAAAVRRLGGLVVQIERNGYEAPTDAHASEAGLSLLPDKLLILPTGASAPWFTMWLLRKEGLLGG